MFPLNLSFKSSPSPSSKIWYKQKPNTVNTWQFEDSKFIPDKGIPKNNNQTKMNAKQIDEARNLVKEANGLSKRSLFRWSPEYDTAATKFEKAATLYKNGKQFNDSVSCYCSAGDCYNKSNSSYLAAKNYECAGNVRRDEVCV